jgi:DNA polymerase-3 subunit gamma/tau
MTREAFNALLKTLEEPPAGVIFVLVTTEPEKLPDTIISRTMEFEFRRVKPSDLLDRVLAVAAAESIDLPNDLAIKIVEYAGGSVRDALISLDLVSRAEISTVEQYVELVGERDVGPLILASLLTNNHATIFSVLDNLMMETGDPRTLLASLNSAIRDLFVLKAGGRINAAGQAYDNRLKLSQLIGANALYAAVTILWELKTKVRQSEDQLSSLEQALILVAEKLSTGKVYGSTNSVTSDTEVANPVAFEEEARPLSLSEIQMS